VGGSELPPLATTPVRVLPDSENCKLASLYLSSSLSKCKWTFPAMVTNPLGTLRHGDNPVAAEKETNKDAGIRPNDGHYPPARASSSRD
jgi:hypothetical protein